MLSLGKSLGKSSKSCLVSNPEELIASWGEKTHTQSNVLNTVKEILVKCIAGSKESKRLFSDGNGKASWKRWHLKCHSKLEFERGQKGKGILRSISNVVELKKKKSMYKNEENMYV